MSCAGRTEGRRLLSVVVRLVAGHAWPGPTHVRIVGIYAQCIYWHPLHLQQTAPQRFYENTRTHNIQQVSRYVKGVLGETFVPTRDANGEPIMKGTEAIRGEQEDCKCVRPHTSCLLFCVGVYVHSCRRTKTQRGAHSWWCLNLLDDPLA